MLEVRSGDAFLVVDRKDCKTSSILPLSALPGYRGGGAATVVELDVPTCAASRADMIEIPAGEFIDRHGKKQYLKRFWIDRTEVTRAAFHVFESIFVRTGQHQAGPVEWMKLNPATLHLTPISSIRFSTAESYCRFMGKLLPTTDQWLKAARGGLVVNGKPNPSPARKTPWIEAQHPRPANVKLTEAQDSQPAPVGTFPDDTSPYHVVDLAGNVSEWSKTVSADRKYEGLREVLGADWGNKLPSTIDIADTNVRPDDDVDYGVGMRCVIEQN